MCRTLCLHRPQADPVIVLVLADNYTAKTGKQCLLGEDGRDAVAGVSNFVKLPSNDYDSLMQAIATVGPVSISVDASWGAYEKGVYNGCSKNHTQRLIMPYN